MRAGSMTSGLGNGKRQTRSKSGGGRASKVSLAAPWKNCTKDGKSVDCKSIMGSNNPGQHANNATGRKAQSMMPTVGGTAHA